MAKLEGDGCLRLWEMGGKVGGRWVAKLLAPACCGSSLGSNPDISQNTKWVT